MLNSLGMGLGNLSCLSGMVTRSICPEHFTGEKGKGGMYEKGTGAQFAIDLGVGWKISPSVDIQPGETFTMADIKEEGAIQNIWLTGQNLDRNSILRFYWDDQEHPSVECPAPDFFAFGWNSEEGGPGGGFPLLSSIPVTVGSCRAFSCFWEMPFRKRCRITMENVGVNMTTLYYQINYAVGKVPEEAAYFHAQWRRTNPVPYKDVHVVLDGVEGRGQYVGMALFAGLNGANDWWGEGEVKFYLDGDKEFPTICGTGLEDYFLGAYDWLVKEKYVPYSFPFAGMYQVIDPKGGLSSQQRFAMYRFHVMDPIRFGKDLRITVQDLGWRYNPKRYLSRRDDFATVAYWYQTLPSVPFPALPSNDDREII